jgi:hypothetical protein
MLPRRYVAEHSALLVVRPPHPNILLQQRSPNFLHDPDDQSKPSVDFRGERRTNATHQSATDPEARLQKAKGQ